jgi:hypothetical protein
MLINMKTYSLTALRCVGTKFKKENKWLKVTHITLQYDFNSFIHKTYSIWGSFLTKIREPVLSQPIFRFYIAGLLLHNNIQ